MILRDNNNSIKLEFNIYHKGHKCHLIVERNKFVIQWN